MKHLHIHILSYTFSYLNWISYQKDLEIHRVLCNKGTKLFDTLMKPYIALQLQCTKGMYHMFTKLITVFTISMP